MRFDARMSGMSWLNAACTQAMRLPSIVRALAERLSLRSPLVTMEEFRADPLVGLAAELMDPLHGVPIPPSRWSAAEIRTLAEGDHQP
jgi:hypothetical protein